ncbi:MAG: metal-sensing transcriptional repressor [Candidatus Buchananbacteria bacterium]
MDYQKEILQLHRLAGQIGGIEKLITQNAKTSAIIQQIEAAKGNLKSLEKSILSKKIKSICDKENAATLNYLLKNS